MTPSRIRLTPSGDRQIKSISIRLHRGRRRLLLLHLVRPEIHDSVSLVPIISEMDSTVGHRLGFYRYIEAAAAFNATPALDLMAVTTYKKNGKIGFLNRNLEKYSVLEY